MAQSYVNVVRMNSENVGVIAVEETHKKRKINLILDSNHQLSISKNVDGETVINIRKGTRSVSLPKDVLIEMCDLKETLLLCCSFVDNM